jgi:hypothetical protein
VNIRQVIHISAPAARVWTAISDVERWPEWTPTVTRLELLDGPGLLVGRRARVRQPGLPVAVWTVTTLDPGRYFEWRNVSPGLLSVAGHRVDAGPLGTSTVTLTFSWTGWLAPFIRLAYGRLASRYVATEAESLKRWCEAPSRAHA